MSSAEMDILECKVCKVLVVCAFPKSVVTLHHEQQQRLVLLTFV